MAELLKKKHDQVYVPGHRAVLVVVNNGSRASAADVTDACAFIEFAEYRNFDRIYFEESPANFHLVYDREAHISMEAGRLPADAKARQLVSQWIDIRLARHCPSAMDIALQISWDQGSRMWLSNSGQENLLIAEQLFIQNCEWSTPRDLWELFRGPLRMIGDGRPTIRPIRAR